MGDGYIINRGNVDDPSKFPAFTYTGDYELVDDGISEGMRNWRLRFLTSGIFKAVKDMTVDVFCVGGGGSASIGSGGGGGYTKTLRKKQISARQGYDVVVGNGGVVFYDAASHNLTYIESGASSFDGENEARGGGHGTEAARGGDPNYAIYYGKGGSGGSGGGAGGDRTITDYGLVLHTPGAGGENGSDGEYSYRLVPGVGQQRNTREFGETDGVLYAGGGDGAQVFETWSLPSGYNRGETDNPDGGASAYQSGRKNTGGGGGGGSKRSDLHPGNGGSGIVIIRNTR